MERVGTLIKGMYRDVLTAGDGRVLYDSGWASNTIVDRCRILLAGFMKNESPSGIQFLAVGQGRDTWDAAEPPTPDATSTDLVNRYNPPIPVDRLNLAYLDEEPQPQVVNYPTHRLQITATLDPGYPTPLAAPLNTYPLREFGLFGRFEGNDYMINSIRHPVIHKDAATTLVRVIRLYF